MCNAVLLQDSSWHIPRREWAQRSAQDSFQKQQEKPYFSWLFGAKLCWTAPEALLLQQPRVRVGPYAEFPCSLFPVLLLPAAPVSQRAAAAVWRWLFLDSFMIHRTNFCLLWNLTVVMGLEVYIKSTNLVVGWAPAMVPWCTTLDIQTGLFVEDFLSTWRLWPRGKFSLGNMTLQRNHL